MKNMNLIIGLIVIAVVGWWFYTGGTLPAPANVGGNNPFGGGNQQQPSGANLVCSDNLGTIPTPEGALSVRNAKVLSSYETAKMKADVYFKIGNGAWTYDSQYALTSDATIDSPAPVGQPVKGKAYIYNTAYASGLDTAWGYTREIEWDVPCLEKYSIATTVELIGTLTPVIHNTDNSASNGSGDTQAISNAQTVNMELSLASSEDTNCFGTSYYSNEYPILAVVDANQLVISVVQFSSAFQPVPAGAPAGHTDTDVNNWYLSAWKLKGAQSICGYNEVAGSLAVTAHATNNTGADADDTGGIASVMYYAPQMYLDQDSGDWIVAYRKVKDGSQIIAPVTQTLYFG